MNDHLTPPSPEAGRGTGYEVTDANVAAIAVFAAGLSVLLAVVFVGLGWLYRDMEKAQKQSVKQLISSPLNPKVPEPRLQSAPAEDLALFLQQEEQKLSSYRWINRERSIVQIPVERSMQLLSERGFPEPKQPLRTLKAEKDAP